MKRWIVLLCIFSSPFFFHPLSWAQTSGPVLRPLTIVKAGTLIDGVSSTARRDQVITIRGNVISEIANASSAKIPADATVIDLSKYTVLPGLIDAHTHGLGSRGYAGGTA